ncbi:MAG: transposase [Phaeodactylibacter sp.]|nr:transposase [Phaeodactylibacter sp.]
MPHRTTEKGELYFVTLTVVDWIDVFTRREYFELIIENIQHCQKHRALELYAYVIMTNHIHMVATCPKEPLNRVLGNFKTYTSKKLVELIRNNPRESRKHWMLPIFEQRGSEVTKTQQHQFWQPGNHPVHLFTEKVTIQKINYIHDNPVRAGFVNAPEEYYYSSAHPFQPLELTPWH